MNRSYQNQRCRSVSRNKSQTTNRILTISMQQGSNSNFRLSHSNYKRNQCDSHFLQLKPLFPNAPVEHTFYKMVHEGDCKPFPAILTQFMNVGLMPIFGLEREIPLLRPKVKKCEQGLEQQVSRLTNENWREHSRPQKLFTPMPKHTICQVCREQFEDYQKHIESWKHRKNANESLGMQYIRNTIDEINMAVYDQNQQQDLRSLIEFNLSLEETIPCVRDHFKQYLANLYAARNQ